MITDVYADMLFFVNFVMNYIVFCLACKIKRVKLQWLRICFSSALCALTYTVSIFILPFYLISNIISAMVILVVGISIIYWPFNKTLRQFIYFIITVWASAFLLAGAAFGLSYLFTSPYSLVAFGIAAETNVTFSLALLLSSSTFIYIIAKHILKHLQKAQIHKQKFYNYKIWLNNAKTEIRGLVDTGNCLSDPISKLPVVVAEVTALKKILPSNLSKLFENRQENEMQLVLDEIAKSSMSSRIRFIPYTAADGMNSVFIGFRPDKIEIENYNKNGSISVNNVIIGICNFKLSPSGEYNSLLNPQIFS